MSGEAQRHRRIRDLLHDALGRVGSERAAYLERACAGDESLRVEVERLLAASTTATTALVGSAVAHRHGSLGPGSMVGTWRLEHEVGSGGMGTVHAARHEVDGTRVALKIIHPHLLVREDARARFRREAELGARVVHPNVVRTLGAAQDQVDGREVHYLVLEFVEGRSLRSVLDDLGSVPEGLLREIARQAAEGLAAIHAAGIVHRDIKPENLMLTDDARLRITDLGVAKPSAASPALTSDGQFIGSLLYASPEQCTGGPVGPASDLYALGVVLYELATGANPFGAQGPWAALQAHVTQVAPAAHERAPGLAPFLSAIITTLLRKVPSERFASASALAAALADGEHGTWWCERVRRLEDPRRPRVPVARDVPLGAREGDLAAWEAAWSDACAGEGRVLSVVGEAGLGKSRLVHEFLAAHAGEDVEVLYGAYPPDGAGGALREALTARFGGPDATERLLPWMASTPDLLPAFVAYVGQAPAATVDTVLDRGARDAAILGVVERITEARPLVWVVEDLHHAAPDARLLLTALARCARGRRMLLLVTSRTPLPSALRETWQRLGHLREHHLERLSTAALEDLVREALQGAAAEHLAPRVAQLADGVPLVAFEVLQHLETTGVLTRGRDGRRVARRRIETLQVPSSLRDAVLGRLGELTRDEAEILDLAAIQGVQFDAAVIARVRGAPRLRVLEVLGHLERRARLVRSDGAGFRFDHQVVHDVVHDAIPPALRAEYHRLVAEMLERPEGGSAAAELPDPVAWRVVHHHLRGSDPSQALPHLRCAMRHLEGLYQREAVVELGRRALVLQGLDDHERYALHLRLGRHLQHLGRKDEAHAMFLQAIGQADAAARPSMRVQARNAMAYQRIESADYEGALAVLDEAEPHLDRDNEPGLASEARSARGQAYWCQGRHEQARACHREALATAREAALPAFEARASSDLAVVCHELGYLDEAEALLRRALTLQYGGSDIRNQCITRSNLANVFFDQGRKGEALEQYEAMRELTRRIGDRMGEAVALVNLGAVWLDLGALADAEVALRRCLVMTRDIGARRVEGFALHGLGQLAASRDDADGAVAHLREALQVRRDIGNVLGVTDSLVTLGGVLAHRGDVDEGRALLEEGLAVALGADDENTVVLAHAWLAALDPARAPQAQARFEAARPRLRHDVALESLYHLWRATGEARHLEAARTLLADKRSRAPSAFHESLVANVPLHRAVIEGCR